MLPRTPCSKHVIGLSSTACCISAIYFVLSDAGRLALAAAACLFMQGLRVAAAAYFGVAAFFVLACFFLYALVLPRLPIIRAQQRAARGLQQDGSDLALGRQARCSALAVRI